MKHPNKDVNKAVQHALEKGWTIKAASGHAWAIIRYPKNKPECSCGMFCQISVWSTPRNPGNFAKQLKRSVDGCIYPITKLYEVKK
jgi:hypothetical protein